MPSDSLSMDETADLVLKFGCGVSFYNKMRFVNLIKQLWRQGREEGEGE